MNRKQLFAYWVFILSATACVMFCGLKACGQSVTPIPAVKPTEICLQRTRPAHLSLRIDGADAQVVSPGLFVIREASQPGVVNLTVIGQRWGTFLITVTTTKDGRLANHQFRVYVGTIFAPEKLP